MKLTWGFSKWSAVRGWRVSHLSRACSSLLSERGQHIAHTAIVVCSSLEWGRRSEWNHLCFQLTWRWIKMVTVRGSSLLFVCISMQADYDQLFISLFNYYYLNIFAYLTSTAAPVSGDAALDKQVLLMELSVNRREDSFATPGWKDVIPAHAAASYSLINYRRYRRLMLRHERTRLWIKRSNL